MKPIEGIYPTLVPTFPRSGYIVKFKVLQEYFGDRLHGVDPYKFPDKSFKKAPKWCNFQKDHDFDLDTEKNKDRLHLIGIRNPVQAIAGWRHMEIKYNAWEKKDWRPWMKEKMLFWAKFCNKWLYSPVPNRLVVSYETMIAAPRIIFPAIIMFMTRTDDYDELKLHRAIEKIGIKEQGIKPLPFDTA